MHMHYRGIQQGPDRFTDEALPEGPDGPDGATSSEHRRGRGGHGTGRRHERHERGERRGPRRGGGWMQGELPDAGDAADWFSGRLPDGWYVGGPSVSVDRDEIIVTGELAPVGGGQSAAEGRIARWREDTREERMLVAGQAQARYGRTVSWGARIDQTDRLFTHVSAPAMTRLRQNERVVLDTLVDAGVARSRSDALAWCVRLVGEHTQDWLGGLRDAMSEVERLRGEGPSL